MFNRIVLQALSIGVVTFGAAVTFPVVVEVNFGA
jgi:hypothetical protein